MSDQTPQEGELILYRTADDAVRVEVLYESETFWLDQRRMAARSPAVHCPVAWPAVGRPVGA